jgi:basic amino acid/polyamine antiporter, APA family
VTSREVLRREIRLPHATAMVVGTIIGASIFVQPSEITGHVPSIAAVLTVWMIAGFLTLIGALVCAELAAMIPETGGVYQYLKVAYHPSVGFLWGWAMFWVMHSGIIAAIAVVFARYTAYFIPLGTGGMRAVAIAAIGLLSAINYVGVKHGSVLQTLFTAGKLAAILAIIVIGFTLGSRLPEHFVTVSPGAPIRLTDFLSALVAGLFAFGGWHMVTYQAGETVDPARTIPRALIGGTVIVTACYVVLNLVYLYVLPLETVASSTRVAADAADAVMGFGGGAVMSAIVMFSSFGALSGIVLAGPRVYYSMASDGVVFDWIGGVHSQFQTPHRAIVLQSMWAAALVATGSYRVLFTRVVYTEWIFFGLMALGLIVLRHSKRSSLYHMWGFPFLPIVFIVASFAIVVNQIVSDPGESVQGLGIVLLGLPVYFLWARNRYVDSERS